MTFFTGKGYPHISHLPSNQWQQNHTTQKKSLVFLVSYVPLIKMLISQKENDTHGERSICAGDCMA